MLAYARAYEAKRLVLIYPWHEGLADPGICRSWQIKGTSTTFDIATVDVGRPDSVQHVLRSIVGSPRSR